MSTELRSAGIQPTFEVAGLSMVAITQPLFDLLRRHGEMLVAHQLNGPSIIVAAVVLSVGPILFFTAPMVALCRAWPRRSRAITGCWIAVLGVLLVLPTLNRIVPWPSLVLIALALSTGAALALARVRWPALSMILAVLSLSVIVCPLVFLATPPVSGLLTSDPAGRDTAAQSHRPILDSNRAVPVIMVVLDELPLISLLDHDGTINARRYPHFARLADQSHWFRTATTVAQSTTYAIPAMLTGRNPDRQRLPTTRNYPENLFTLLDASGYALTVDEPHTELCPPRLRTYEPAAGATARVVALLRDLAVVYGHRVLPESWRRTLPSVDTRWAHFTKAQREHDPDRLHYVHAPDLSFDRFVAALTPRPEPTLHFLHILLPHMPWTFLPSGKRFEGPRPGDRPHGLDDQRWLGDPAETRQAYQLHLLQVGFVDTLMGRLLDQLIQSDLFDQSLLVVVADHGASFQHGQPRRRLTESNQAEIANIPLFIKMPGQRTGVVDDRNVMSIDILPTIAAAIGLPLHPGIDGRDLFAPAGPRPDQPLKYTYATGRTGGSVGQRFVYSQEHMLRQRERLVARKRAWFGRAPRRLLAVGPHRKLVGRTASDLAVPADLARSRARVDQASALRGLDRRARQLPVFVSGHLDGVDPTTKPAHLAIALHGVVQATATPYTDDRGQVRFSAMVGEYALRDGDNPLTLYAIQGPPGGESLHPITVEPAQATNADSK